ncbi:MAG: hypothetical protein R6W78_17555 [Bacteroidales bacterium]
MKNYFFITCIVLFPVLAHAQDGAEHKITNIIGVGRVEINIGEQFEIKINDVFQVFGKGQIIHPATGKIVERDNIYLGKIKVIEVKELSSVAEIIEKKGELSIGSKIVKVVSAEQEVIENKRPLQAEFENPSERNYSETIYKQNDKKGKPNTDVHIIKITKENEQLLATIDKGNKTKSKGGKLTVGKEYYIFVPIVDTSAITGQQRRDGEDYIGDVKIKTVEHDASTGYLSLNKEASFTFLEKNNYLLPYIPKNKGWNHILRFNFMSFNYLDGKQHSGIIDSLGKISEEKMFSFLNGLEIINGYRFSPLYFIGIGIGYNNETYYEPHEPYRNVIIRNMPIYLHQRFNLINARNSISINLTTGKNIVLNKTNDLRPYDIKGNFYLAGGIGTKTYIKKYGAILIDIDFELKKYQFIDYFIYSINGDIEGNNEGDLMPFLKLKLGYEFN